MDFIFKYRNWSNPSSILHKHYLKRNSQRGARVGQSVKHQTSAQVIILWFVGLSPKSGSVLTAQSLEPDLDLDSLTPPLPLMLCLSLKINKHKKFLIKNK